MRVYTRKLDDIREREIALAYLCGVNPDALCVAYNVSKSTITANIIARRSREWNDALVEFYRETSQRKRQRNSAHLYLAFSNLDVPKKELVNTERDRPVYNVVSGQLIAPHLDQIIKKSALGLYVHPRLKSSYESLLDAILGYKDEDSIVEPLFRKELSDAYSQGSANNLLESASRQTLFAIAKKIKHSGLLITPLKKEIIEGSLQGLPEREQDILAMRFGLRNYRKRFTLDQVAENYQITGPRARQLEFSALHKLRHPSSAKKLRQVHGLVTDEEIMKYLEELKFREEKRLWKSRLYDEIRNEARAEVLAEIAEKSSPDYLPPEIEKTLATKLEHVEFSGRAHNCLASIGIRTLGDLVKKTESQLLKTRQLGRKSLKEIKEVLKLDYNLELAKG